MGPGGGLTLKRVLNKAMFQIFECMIKSIKSNFMAIIGHNQQFIRKNNASIGGSSLLSIKKRLSVDASTALSMDSPLVPKSFCPNGPIYRCIAPS